MFILLKCYNLSELLVSVLIKERVYNGDEFPLKKNPFAKLR